MLWDAKWTADLGYSMIEHSLLVWEESYEISRLLPSANAWSVLAQRDIELYRNIVF